MADFASELRTWLCGNTVYHTLDVLSASAGVSGYGAYYDPTPDTTDKVTGSASLQCGCSGSMGFIGQGKIIPTTDLTGTDAGIFSKVKNPSILNAASGVIVVFGNNSIANCYAFFVPASAVSADTWQRYGGKYEDADLILGSPSVSAINYIEMRWTFAAATAVPLGDLKFNYAHFGNMVPLAASATFNNKMVSAPANQIAIFDAGGVSEYYNPKEMRSLRFLVRGSTRSQAIDLANQVYDLIHCGGGSALLGVDLTSFHVYSAYARMRPQAAGVDENNQPLIAFDADFHIRAI